MKKVKKEVVNCLEEPETAYLTTRALERALGKATRNLTEDAMNLRGYVVTLEGNWVVKKFSDGKVEKIEKRRKVKLAKQIVLS